MGMRILLVSDIHANRPALEAIREDFNVCLFLGDLVDYCLEPGPCIDWVRANARYCVRGNHDHGAAQKVYVQGLTGFKYLTGVTRPITMSRLSEPHRRFLSEMPLTRLVTLNGKRIFLVHATPRDPLDEFAPADVEFWKRRLEHIDADYVCVGHTHAQYILQVGKTTVINPGSVGLPRDGEPLMPFSRMKDLFSNGSSTRLRKPLPRSRRAPCPKGQKYSWLRSCERGDWKRRMGMWGPQ